MSFNDVGKKPSTASGTQVPVYLPQGTVAGSPYGTLYGRPVIPVQACPTVGDEGDIILADLTQYLSVVRTGGIKTDVSMHLYFDYGQQAFRFVFRMHGQPWWNAAITPENGSNNLSCFVTIAAR
jgi:HK97 family phage major capsid protein